MHQERENLDILFRRTAPETVLNNIKHYKSFSEEHQLIANTMEYPYMTYDHYASINMSEYSRDETKIRFDALMESMQWGKDKKLVFFKPLCDYADKVLKMCGENPVCRIERILGWNSITKRLGQDILVTAWLAWNDVNSLEYNTSRKKFIWPAVLKTDDIKLKYIFNKGLAENHFHLHGSTQSFALSWACLMNHPGYIYTFFKKNGNFNENLDINISKGVSDNSMEWEERILYAVIIRALLFEKCCGTISSEQIWKKFYMFDRLHLNTKLSKYIETLRECYGAKFNQQVNCNQTLHGYYGTKFSQQGNYKVCLDYAACNYLYNLDKNSPNRILASERSFLYHCFRLHFESKLLSWESSLFYLYLLIKSKFRSEIIQVNGRSGFANFAKYQDRKKQFFNLKEYEAEALKLSVCAAAQENNIVSLEARIMPMETAQQMKEEISKIDSIVQFESSFDIKKLYYVIHFPKSKFELESAGKDYLMLPRNWKARENAEKKAKALVKYLQYYNNYDYNGIQRVFGIDACSSEIGCRPETFATEFRYIRKYGIRSSNCYWNTGQASGKMGATYHVGEDFLDIADGLRAIDEALMFLQLEKGDRIGHATVLGIEPKKYYESKGYNVYMTKQDYLDNLVWILYKSLEFEITINANYRSLIREEAEKLLLEIYFHDNPAIKKYSFSSAEFLNAYYYSWKLRGDHPELYKKAKYKTMKWAGYDFYFNCMKQEKLNESYRSNKLAVLFYYLYHFDYKVKETGLKTASFKAYGWYISLMGKFQEAMCNKVVSIGIVIECNPTSNVLISTFKDYDKHPILSFNHFRLEDSPNKVNIQATINTDDIGVFDTSLENEYALLFSAISRARHEKHNYDDEAIYEYLDYLRENGIMASFMRRQIMDYDN